VPAVQSGEWIPDVTYERFANHREGDAFFTQTVFPTETIHLMESVQAFYDLVV
jgi:hypothetical protein